MENEKIKSTDTDVVPAGTTPEENPEKSEKAPTKKGLLKKLLCFLPSLILILIGLRMKWMTRGTALLFTDSASGKALRLWWLLIILGIILAIVPPVVWLVKKSRKPAANDEKAASSAKETGIPADAAEASETTEAEDSDTEAQPSADTADENK